MAVAEASPLMNNSRVSSDAGALHELQARYDRLAQLYHVSNVIHSTLEPQQALQLILGAAIQLTRATGGSAVLINPTTNLLEIQASQGLSSEAQNIKLRVGQGITGWVALSGKPARVGHVLADARYVQVNPDIRSEMAVPLEVRGEVRGVLNVDSTRPEAFTEEDLQLLQALALQASHVIQNTWLYEQVRLKASWLETLVQIGQNINQSISLDETLQGITREACVLMSARMSSILLMDPTGEWLDLLASFGAGAAYKTKPRLSVEDSLLGVVIRRKKALQVEDIQNSSQYQNVEMARTEGLVSLLSVPLVFSGKTIGALNVYTGQFHNFSDEEVRVLSMLAELSAIAIERARLHERIVDFEEQLRQNEQLSAIGLLAAEVAHEIRNPLTVMKMLFHSLDLKFPATDPRARDAQIMVEKMDLLNKIVEQILDYARHSEPHRQPVNINRVIEDLGLLTRHKLRKHGIELIRRLAPDLPLVRGDSTQLEQAFLNLTLNAVEAMPNGGRLTITTRPLRLAPDRKDPSHVRIEFRDTGEGMSPEQHQRALSPLLSTTKTKGTGLGLRIIGRVVETHEGKLKIKGKPGQGTVIMLTLPGLSPDSNSGDAAV